MLGVTDMIVVIWYSLLLSEVRLFFPRKKFFFEWKDRGKQLE